MAPRIFASAIAAVLLASTASAHMILNTPKPFGNPDNGPLTAAQWPCKKNLGFEIVETTNLAVGTTQKLTFKGTATHGGGGCQLAITTDTEPTENSDFRVIKTFEGTACPPAENQPGLDYTLPKEIKNGAATFAWTWISFNAGQAEYYMNCAPVIVSGGSDDASAMQSLPKIMVANISPVSTCTANAGVYPIYPDPGSDLDLTGFVASKAAAPVGDCGAKGNTPVVGTSAAAAQPSASTPANNGGNGGGGNNGLYTPSTPQTTAAAGGGGGGNFAEGAAPSPTAASPSSAANAPAEEATATLTTLITVTASKPAGSPIASSVVPAPVVPSAAIPSPNPVVSTAPIASSPATGGGNGQGAASTSCTTDGAIVCNGASQFGLCDHGSVVWQSVAAGTTCSNGAIVRKRVVRGAGGLGPFWA